MSMTKIDYVGKVYETERYGRFTVIKDLGLHQLYENNPQRYRLLEIQWETQALHLLSDLHSYQHLTSKINMLKQYAV